MVNSARSTLPTNVYALSYSLTELLTMIRLENFVLAGGALIGLAFVARAYQRQRAMPRAAARGARGTKRS